MRPCKACGHPREEHHKYRGVCSHVDLNHAITTGADIVCQCLAYVPEDPGWVIDVQTLDGNWSTLDESTWPTMDAAEQFALAQVGAPYTIRREAA